MEHRKSKNFWLKLVGACVSHSVLVGFAIVFWKLHVAPLLLTEGDGTAWIALVAVSSAIAYGVLPAVASVLLLGRFYGLNFFKEFWHRRERPYDMEARFLTMLTAMVSVMLSMGLVAWPLFGEGPFNLVYIIHAMTGSLICAAPLADSIVHGERTLAGQNRVDNGAAEETGA